MFGLFRTDSILRAATVSVAAAFALSACGGGNDTGQTGSSAFEVEGDHAVGDPDAPVTVVEYASVTCGHCANWHTTVYSDFKEKYVDTGKVRYIFREFPTAPENLAYAGFTIANCADESRFLENISIQFQRQRALLTAQNIRRAYEDLAKASGLTVAEYEACLADEQWRARYDEVIQGGIDAGVTGTPTFFINGEKEQVFLLEDFDEVILPLLGETVPAEVDDTEDTAVPQTDANVEELSDETETPDTETDSDTAE